MIRPNVADKKKTSMLFENIFLIKTIVIIKANAPGICFSNVGR